VNGTRANYDLAKPLPVGPSASAARRLGRQPTAGDIEPTSPSARPPLPGSPFAVHSRNLHLLHPRGRSPHGPPSREKSQLTPFSTRHMVPTIAESCTGPPPARRQHSSVPTSYWTAMIGGLLRVPTHLGHAPSVTIPTVNPFRVSLVRDQCLTSGPCCLANSSGPPLPSSSSPHPSSLGRLWYGVPRGVTPLVHHDPKHLCLRHSCRSSAGITTRRTPRRQEKNHLFFPRERFFMSRHQCFAPGEPLVTPLSHWHANLYGGWCHALAFLGPGAGNVQRSQEKQ